MSYNLEQFKDGLKELQIELNEKQISQFLKYYELLVETNKVMNLTAITEFDEVVEKHFLDSLSLCRVYDLKIDAKILDLGTGTGLGALMLAQRRLPDANIVALEIDEAAAGQAKENVARSPWKDRIEVVKQDFLFYQSPDKFDVIVSNPPYFVDSLSCPDQQRSMARHNDSLTYEKLLKGVADLLMKEGTFTIVIPTDVADRVKTAASEYHLYATRQLNVITKPGGTPKRMLITFTFNNEGCIKEELLTEVARHQYSEEIKELTREYYLHLK